MSSPFSPPARNLWPHAIITWFVIFGSALAAWVTFSLRQRVDLVRADYYEDEVHYQRQLDRLNRTARLRSLVGIRYEAASGAVTIRLPADHAASMPTGRILFYRPSDAALDFAVALAVDRDGCQTVRGQPLQPGFWRVRIEWAASGAEYFFEEVFVADAGPALDRSGRGLVAVGLRSE